MNILIISPSYPDRYKVHYTFVKQLVDEFARQGHRCFVIAPYSITKNRRFYTSKEYDGDVLVFRPNYLSFSNLTIGKFRPSVYFRRKAIYKALKWLTDKPDVVYCHFWISAVDVYPFVRQNNLPLFVASGESTISSFFDGMAFPEEIKAYVRGVI